MQLLLVSHIILATTVLLVFVYQLLRFLHSRKVHYAHAAALSLVSAAYIGSITWVNSYGAAPGWRQATMLAYLSGLIFLLLSLFQIGVVVGRILPFAHRLGVLSLIVWIPVVTLSHWVVSAQPKLIHFSLVNQSYPLPRLSPGLMIFFAYLLGLIVLNAYWLLAHRRCFANPWESLLWLLFVSLLAVAGVHDMLAAAGFINHPMMYLVDYNIVLFLLILLFRDQSQQHKDAHDLREALQNRDKSLLELLRNSPDMAAILDKSGRILFANSALTDFLGYSEDAVLGRSFDIALPKNARSRALERATQLFLTKKSTPAERSALQHRDGQVLLVETMASLVMLNDQPAVVVLARDLSQRQAFEARMHEMDRMVAIGMLAAGVAHEINNPLTFVSGNIELINEDLEELQQSAQVLNQATRKRLQQYGHDALEGCTRIADIVRDLSQLSRQEQHPDGPVDIRKIAQSALKLSHNELKHHAQVVTKLPKVAPAWGDSARLTQVLVNLLVNAAQAIPMGRNDENEVSLSLFEKDNNVLIEVRDTGSGIAPDLLSHVFDPFVTTKPPGQGTGLGLAICRRIVEDHGGELTVTSELGQGSTFSLLLPKASPGQLADDDSLIPPAEAAEKLPAPDGKSKKPTVLLVDDDAKILHTLERMLSRTHAVTAYSEAEEALSILQKKTFDVVICDLMMPKVTGWEFLEIVQQLQAKLAERVILMTGGILQAGEKKRASLTGYSILQKPFSRQQLYEAINSVAKKT